MATKDEAIAQATALLGSGAADLLADPSFGWDTFLPMAVTPDAEGRLPGTDGYVPTYCAFWLAGEVATYIAAQTASTGHATHLTVDGDSITTTEADWMKLAEYLFGKSPISLVCEPSNILRVDGRASHYIPTSRGLYASLYSSPYAYSG